MPWLEVEALLGHGTPATCQVARAWDVLCGLGLDPRGNGAQFQWLALRCDSETRVTDCRVLRDADL